MLDQAYRVIRTLEKTLALMVYTGYSTSEGKEAMCPFCKAKAFQKVHSRATRNGLAKNTFSQVLRHEKDCEVMRLLEEMEEWGCRP
jgi:hypothetical protein